MPNSYDPNRISALRALSKSGDDDGFRQAVDLHTEHGLPIEEIQQAIQASEWRYVVEGCGTSVALKRRSELLGDYDEMLEQIEETLATMTDLDDVRGGPKGMLRHRRNVKDSASTVSRLSSRGGVTSDISCRKISFPIRNTISVAYYPNQVFDGTAPTKSKSSPERTGRFSTKLPRSWNTRSAPGQLLVQSKKSDARLGTMISPRAGRGRELWNSR